MRKTLLIMIALAVTGFGLNCGDDSTGPNEGDYSSDSYEQAKLNFDESMAEFNDDLSEAVDSLFAGFLTKPANPDTVNYDSTDGWHIRSWQRMNEFLTHTVVDSFRFSDEEGEYQRFRDEYTDRFERRLKREFTYMPEGDGFTSWQKTRNRNMDWIGLTETEVTLNGDLYRYYYGSNPQRLFEHEVAGDFNDVIYETADVFNGRPIHPLSGEFVGSFETFRALGFREVSIAGEFTVTFFADHYHVHLVSGDNYWDWDHYYEG